MRGRGALASFLRLSRSAVLLWWVALVCCPPPLCASPFTSSLSLSSSLSLLPVPLSNVTNHWAVLVSTSRYWFNYRHAANALSLYRIVKRAGIPDSRILLFLPDDFACQPRNGLNAGRVFNSASHALNLYEEDDVEVDYRGADVTVEAFLRLLHGRHASNVGKQQRLQSDRNSAILLYLSGHGGDGFLKFQDSEELSAVDLAYALHSLHLQSRYAALLLILDTCQAESMAAQVTSPSIVSIASSRVGQNSYSHHVDAQVGLALIDRFTAAVLDFFEQPTNTHHHHAPAAAAHTPRTLHHLLLSLTPSLLHSDAVTRADLFPVPLSQVPLSAFFAAEHAALPVGGGGGRGRGYVRRKRAADDDGGRGRAAAAEEGGRTVREREEEEEAEAAPNDRRPFPLSADAVHSAGAAREGQRMQALLGFALVAFGYSATLLVEGRRGDAGKAAVP